ncbi:MAG: GHKL domain-containing protein, partial [Clostridiaceae bacterium]|nr:GHKL domain-containing protein [Clostridiaceae bacterium]
EELITLLRTERHDYISHIQSIEALLYLEEYEELSDYVKGIATEYRVISQIVRVGHPAFTAILNTKREVAKEKGIDFIIDCRHKMDNIELNSWELNSLFSNLIENAIESAALEPKRKKINLIIDRLDDNFIISIENSGRLDDNLLASLYEPGISTKGSTARGYGLYICKNILDKYKGNIEAKNTKNQTVVFTITLPIGGTMNGTKTIS